MSIRIRHTIVSATLVFVLLCGAILTRAQVSPQNVVFEGAGIRGVAYCGAIKALEEKQLLDSIQRVGGTSAGAITALCVSLGYTSGEISDLLYRTNFKKFNDGRFLFPGGINRLRKYFGWYRGEKFAAWIRSIVQAKTGNADITFQELYDRGFKDLYITATVLNQQKLMILSKHTYPRMKVADAVRISVSIPLYFEAVFVGKDGEVIRRPREKSAVDVMVDGGFTGNFPIRIFDTVLAEGKKEVTVINPRTIGFRIDTREQILNDSAGSGLVPVAIADMRQYMWAFYNMIIENLNRQPLTAADWSRTISIDDGRIGPKIRRLSRNEIDLLIQNGYLATLAHLRMHPDQPVSGGTVSQNP